MKKYSVLFLALGLFLGGCSDNDETQPVTYGTLNMHFDTRANPALDFALGKAFATASGDSVKLESFLYFVSNVQLIKADGSVFKEPNSYHLIQVTQQGIKEEFLVKEIPAGEYTKVRFLVGVDAEHNQTTANAVGDLATPNSHMTWDWNTGYIFLNANGTYAKKNTSNYQLVTYEIGKDPCARWVELSLPASNPRMQIGAQHTPEMHLHTYTANIFSGANSIDISANPRVSGEPQFATVSQQIADNFPGMFKIDHVHTH